MQSHILADIGKSIIAAGVFGLPAYFFRVPLILAYIMAGILIGPFLGLGLVSDNESIMNISEIGLVLLMFILGLEINLKKLFETGKTVLLTGSVQIIGSFLITFIFFYFYYGRTVNYETVYLAGALSLSSTLIVVKILSDKIDLDSLPSRITLGVLVLQDLFVVGLLAVQPSLSNIQLVEVGFSFARVIILVTSSFLIARYILPLVFKLSSKHSELLLILAMGWCFGMCGFANYLKLSLEMGALIAGISIASFPYHLDVAAKIVSLRDFFITLFFVGLGLQIPIPSVEIIYFALIISGLIFITRMVTVFPLLHNFGYANRISLIPTINLSQVSEFSLVLCSIGITYKHIQQPLLVSFIFALILTSFISSVAIPRVHEIYKFLNPYLLKLKINDDVKAIHQESSEEKVSSIVFLGFHRDTSSLFHEYLNSITEDLTKKVIVVDFNPEVNIKLTKHKIKCIFGDISNAEVLKAAEIANAEMIICTLTDITLKGTTNLKLLQIVKKLNPNAKIIMTAENIKQAREMYQLGAHYVYLPRIIGANKLFEVIQLFQANNYEITDLEIEKLKSRNEIIS